GGDAGNGFLAESPGIRDRADELAIDVHGAAGHAGDDTDLFEVEAREPGEDQVASGAGVAENTEDFDLECLDLRPLHDGSASALHATAEVLDLPAGGHRLGHGSGLAAGHEDKGSEGGNDEDRPPQERTFDRLHGRLQEGG